jgi:hypothetical protein
MAWHSMASGWATTSSPARSRAPLQRDSGGKGAARRRCQDVVRKPVSSGKLNTHISAQAAHGCRAD